MAEYIDRDEALHALGEFSLAWEYGAGVKDCYEALEKVPVADVAPMVHAKWDGDTCTSCKLPWNYLMVQDADDWGYFDPMPEFCPNCGAKMDLEVVP